MDVYPPEYVHRNLPLLVLAGLRLQVEQHPPRNIQDVLPGEATTLLSSEAPAVTSERSPQLLEELLKYDGSEAGTVVKKTNEAPASASFEIRVVGRNFQLPAKKADAPSPATLASHDDSNDIPLSGWTLHSPISPLSPRSTLFPDGIMAPSWIAKHQHYIPSMFVSFYDFSTDSITNSLHDNQLKNEINKLKTQLQRSNHRTRFAVFLVSDTSIVNAPEIEDRLAAIRRSTGLDSKTQLFFLQPGSPSEMRSFVANVMSSLRTQSTEYYRDLTKHTRRKKGRGTIPAPTIPPNRGTSQALSQIAWNTRYEFKLGVFAEFRQEMDAAQRHYGIALDTLFSPEGLCETTAIWSPRWDEIRLLADAVALRYIRCQLASNLPTSAARTWIRYKGQLRDVLDRRGKGSLNYGWEAWESTWATMMAQTVQQTNLEVFRTDNASQTSDTLSEHGTLPTYAQAEKQVSGADPLSPWMLLHHAGYWYRVAAEHAKRRYLLARGMSEEDRTPPGMSPATKVSTRNQLYDTYLVPQPHVEYPLTDSPGGFSHWKDITQKLGHAIREFETRSQHRRAQHLQLELARNLLHVKQFIQAFKVLRPLWQDMAWRREGWWHLASEVLWGLHECALCVDDAETYVATEWELYARVFTGKNRYKHDLASCLQNLRPRPPSDTTMAVLVDSSTCVSCVSVALTFAAQEGHVGEPMLAQVIIKSTARIGSAPITISNMKFEIEGCLSEVRLHHEANSSPSTDQPKVLGCVLEEELLTHTQPRWHGRADMTIHAGQVKGYNFPITFREAGEIKVVTSRFQVLTQAVELSVFDNKNEYEQAPAWWVQSGDVLRAQKLHRDSKSQIKILPKPPKMEIALPGAKDYYYTDEPVTFAIELCNREEEGTEAVLEVRLLGHSRDSLRFSWIHTTASPMKEQPPQLDHDFDLPGHVVGQLAQGERTTEQIHFTAPAEAADYILEIKVLYHLLSDRETPLSKTLIADLVFFGPFESSYELTPRLHPDPWPNYFVLDDADALGHPNSTDAFGMAQMWHLNARLASFAKENMLIKDLSINIHSVHGNAACSVLKEFAEVNHLIEPEKITDWSFSIECRRFDLEERRATALDTTLDITWQRAGDPCNPEIRTSLQIPRIHIPSAEPRMLATLVPSSSESEHEVVYLDYVLENPTIYFLTFEISMEASDDFGFSGPKIKILQVLPMSRQTVKYSILPHVSEGWVSPAMKVVDRYFNKTLKVQATDGLKADKKGISFWVGAQSKAPV